jgi:hypothetical protein
MRTILFIISYLAGTTATAQNQLTDTSVTCVSYWKQGDVRYYEVKNLEVKKKNNQPETKDSSISKVKWTVLKETPSSYTLQWEYMGGRCTSPACISESNAAWLFRSIKFIYQTSETGVFVKLLNLEQVRQQLNNYLKVLADSVKRNVVAQKTLESVKTLFNKRETIEQFLLKEIGIFHQYYGMELTRNPQQADVEVPNIFGSDLVPMRLSLWFSSYQPADSTFAVTSKMVMDEQKGRAIFIKSMSSFVQKSAPGNISAKELQQNMTDAVKQLRLTDDDTGTFCLQSGCLKSVSHRRMITVDGQTQMIYLSITETTK